MVEPAEEFEVLAQSSYIFAENSAQSNLCYVQVQKSTKRLIYGSQFHAEINVSYNQGTALIKNFLKMAKNR